MLRNRLQHIRIVGLAAGVIGATIGLAGCGGGDSSTQGQGAAPSPTMSGGAGGMGGPPGGGAGGPQMSMSGGGGQMMGGPTMGGAPGAAPGGPVVASKPANATPPPHRPDPFKPWWGPPPPPPVLSYLSPVRIAAPSAEPPPTVHVEVQEVPNRRVAGILTGNGVYALLDSGDGQPKVVKPGDVLDDGYRVVRISSNSVTLKKDDRVANRTYTQVVPLTDAGSTTTFSGPPAGAPGGPGFMPGGPGFPGRGRGGGFPGGPSGVNSGE